MKNEKEEDLTEVVVVKDISDAPQEVKDMIVKAIMSGNVVWASQPSEALLENGKLTKEQVEAMILKSIVGGKPN